MGVTDLVFPRFLYVAEGERFCCGAPMDHLCKLYRDKNDKNAGSLLDLVEFVQGLTTKELGNANGIWINLSAGDCIISPPGWFMCESILDSIISILYLYSMSFHFIVSIYTASRRTPWSHLYSACWMSSIIDFYAPHIQRIDVFVSM